MSAAELLFAYVYDKSFFYQLLAAIITFATIRLALFIRVRKRRHQLLKYYGIPGPEPRLLDGNLNDYVDRGDWLQLFAYCHQKYGKVFGTFMGDHPSIIISDLDLAKKVFLKLSPSSFKARTFHFMHTPVEEGILFAKYDRWRFFRKVMSPLFSSYKVRGGSSTMFIEDSIKPMLDYIEEKSATTTSTGEDTSIDIQDLMKATTLHTISALTAIQLPVQVRENEEYVCSLDAFLSRADKGVILAAIELPFMKPILEFLAKHFEHGKTMLMIRRLVNRHIDQGLRNLERVGKGEAPQRQQRQLMDLLIRLHHEARMTRTELMGNVEGVLLAGYDTTSTTMTYLFWVLAKHPHVQERLRTELATDGIKSKYLVQVIHETMRLYPTLATFVTRVAAETVQLDNLTIAEGTRVVYNALAVHHDPDVWPEPTRFEPERFKDPAGIHPCAFGPFGFGDRKCLGYSLALLEMKMLTCVLLRYRLKLVSPRELDITSYAIFLTKAKEKLLIRLEKL